jgi:hypothetical protein
MIFYLLRVFGFGIKTLFFVGNQVAALVTADQVSDNRSVRFIRRLFGFHQFIEL